jgi:hypothetical protein
VVAPSVDGAELKWIGKSVALSRLTSPADVPSRRRRLCRCRTRGGGRLDVVESGRRQGGARGRRGRGCDAEVVAARRGATGGEDGGARLTTAQRRRGHSEAARPRCAHDRGERDVEAEPRPREGRRAALPRATRTAGRLPERTRSRRALCTTIATTAAACLAARTPSTAIRRRNSRECRRPPPATGARRIERCPRAPPIRPAAALLMIELSPLPLAEAR